MAMIAALCLTSASFAQTTDKVPREIGNRANGFSYQLTPNEVVPREQQAGIRPSTAQQKATDAELDRIYNSLMREERPGEKTSPK
jgi:hypothetical protein